MSIPRIIVLDGHDGAGKSSLSALLADGLQARIIRPFQGAIAECFTELVEQERLVELDTLYPFSGSRCGQTSTAG